MRHELVKKSLRCLKVFGFDAYLYVPKENRTKIDNKVEKCLFIHYQHSIKGYKLWNLVANKIIYSQDVVFREIKVVSKQEVQPRGEELETIELELEGEESNSVEEDELEEEESQTTNLTILVQERSKTLKVYSTCFFSSFVLFVTLDHPRTIREAMDSQDSKLRKMAMVEEIDALHKNVTWDLLDLSTRKKTIGM